MKMKKTSAFFWSLIILFSLSACNSQGEQTLVIPSDTPIPSSTPLPSATTTQRPSTTSAATLIPPYPLKPVLLDYSVSSAARSDFPMYSTDFAWSRLVIYTDGQLIIPGKTYRQKMLSSDEINQLLSQLENLKFFELETNQRHDPTDKLYNMGDHYQKAFDASTYCVFVKEQQTRTICAFEPFLDYLVPEMKSILKLLDEYEPDGLSPYYPDRILLWVQVGRVSYVDNLPKNAIPWPENYPRLGPSTWKVIYFQGDVAREIFALFDNTISYKVFSEDSIEYTVGVEVVLPHEELTNIP